MNPAKKKLITGFLLLGSFFSLVAYVLRDREIFSERFDPFYWQQRYEKSQWAKGFAAEEQMGDAELYAYAGWRQIQGMDPTEINAEQPPTGKYLLGFSSLLFNSPLVLSPILGLSILVIIFLIALKITDDYLWSAIAVSLLSFDSLFRENLTTSMLDLPFTLFISLAFYCLLQAEKKTLFFLPALFFLALASTTKVYLAGIGLLAGISVSVLLISILKKEPKYLSFFFFLPFFFLTYLAVYLRYFLTGKTLGDFKYLHFWIRHFARVQVTGYPKGQIFNILISGRWLTWWEGFKTVFVNQWQIFWPLSFFASLLAGFLAIKRQDYRLLLMTTWIFSFLLMYNFGVPYPRYLLPILPPLYISLAGVARQVSLKGRQK
ncbi:MAG TPA: hypothetical protein VMW41_05390 [Candidatus Bathyarchaeia archaeon]|nr:hypothetical protein [Candidatus Bathyarchaeia archaeon]